MSKKRAECPGCGAPVFFNIDSSLVVVCENCRAIVARTELKVEEIGKVAAIAFSSSPLQLGMTGLYNGKSFHLTGRAQLKHAMGGMWDEWYVAFSNERWGWLAEAQGRFYLTFEQKLPQQAPPFSELEPGHALAKMQRGSLVVAETGTAEYAAAEGEIPFRIEAGKTYEYADLSGPQGEFGTLSYLTSPPTLYLGKEITLQELGISAEAFKAGEAKEKQVTATKLSCPHCGGALELKAPDKAERVICQYCNSMLDVENGNFRYLETLEKFQTPFIKLGSRGEFDGHLMTVIGYMQRSTVIEGERWRWDEYLMYHPAVGYRWLVFSDDEWLFVKPLNAGELVMSSSGRTVEYKNRNYIRVQSSVGEVEHVLGEFYWKVKVGETVNMEDFQSGSSKISKESSTYSGGGGEVNWSHGNAISHSAICRKFGIPYSDISGGANVTPPWLIIAIVICVILLFIWIAAENDSGSGTYRSSGGTYRRTGGSGGWSGGFGGFGGGK